jgi:hypothetical protein
MKGQDREDFGYYEAPIDRDEVNEARERKEAHDESERVEKTLRERIEKERKT